MSKQYMCYEEIVKQREALEECVSAVLTQKEALIKFFSDHQPDQIFMIGCTSPYYAAESASSYWQSALGISTRAVTSSEFLQFPQNYFLPSTKSPALIVLSRSGKTTETVWALEEFEKKFPGRSIYIGCSAKNTLTEIAKISVRIPSGYEESLPQTRSFSSMYLATLFICSLLSQQNEIAELLIESPNEIERIITTYESITCEATKGNHQKVIVLGSGPLYGIAREASLKFTEMSITDSIPFPFMESRHGPRSIIDKNTLTIGLMSTVGNKYEARVIKEYTQDLHTTSVALTPYLNMHPISSNFCIPVNLKWPDSIIGLAYLPIFQLLSYYLSIHKGINPDISRNTTSFIIIDRL